jgi:hypothetical protein
MWIAKQARQNAVTAGVVKRTAAIQFVFQGLLF